MLDRCFLGVEGCRGVDFCTLFDEVVDFECVRGTSAAAPVFGCRLSAFLAETTECADLCAVSWLESSAVGNAPGIDKRFFGLAITRRFAGVLHGCGALAQCDNRSQVASFEISGAPEDLLNRTYRRLFFSVSRGSSCLYKYLRCHVSGDGW